MLKYRLTAIFQSKRVCSGRRPDIIFPGRYRSIKGRSTQGIKRNVHFNCSFVIDGDDPGVKSGFRGFRRRNLPSLYMNTERQNPGNAVR